MNISSNRKDFVNPMKIRSRLSLLMLMVFMITLFAGIVVTSGCGENENEEKLTIKAAYERSEERETMDKIAERLKKSGFYSDFKWYTPGDNSLVYEYYFVPNFPVNSDKLEELLDTSIKTQIHLEIDSNIRKGIAEYSVTAKFFDNGGNLLRERTYTKDS